jgi:heat shock protein HslJ
MPTRIVCAFAIGLVLTGCGGSGTTDETSSGDPSSRRSGETAGVMRDGPDSAAARSAESPVWTLASMEVDGETPSLVSRSEITLSFVEPSGVVGSAGVNRYSGDFTRAEDGRIVWSDAIASTKMAGPPDLMAQEDTFLEALRRTDDMILEKDALVLQSGDGSVRLVFR